MREDFLGELSVFDGTTTQDDPDPAGRTILTAQYEALGGTEHIVRRHFEKVIEALPFQDQTLAFEMFAYLVTARGTKMVYRDEDLADEKLLDVPVERVQRILDHLARSEARILRSDQRPDGTWYELYHDVFVEIIQDWAATFREDESQQIYGHLARATRRWQREDQDPNLLLQGVRLAVAREWSQRHAAELSAQEQVYLTASVTKQRQATRFRGLVIGLVLLTVGAIPFALLSLQKAKAAQAASRQAEVAQRYAEELLSQTH
jgi:hypothetical protein